MEPSQPAQATHAGLAVERGGALDPATRKRLAKWVALILGVAVGLWRFQWAWQAALHAPRGLGWTAFGFTTPWLAAVPLAVLGLCKPRWAAYGFAASFLIRMATPLRAAQSLGDVLGYLLFPGLLALPFALVAVLFFYASQPSALNVEPRCGASRP